MILQEVCSYVADKIDNSALNKNNYISTENMMQNCGGITSASNVPVGKSTRFIEGDILFSNIRPYFKKLWRANISGGCSADVLCIRANEKINPTYLYYLLTQDSFISYVMAGTKGCKMPRGDKQYNMAWNINLPSLDVQEKIAVQLSEIDDKIAVNRRICENLEAQAQALFKHWFIDFAPFKNGKFVESELGMIPEGWRVGSLFDIAEVHDSKRKPLSGMQRAKMEKVYPYYGATEQMDMVDDYIFDGRYVLMGEDGSVVRENGLPYIQYVWGKIWVNNHAHVLTGKNGFTTEMLIPFLTKYNIKGLVTGAVQAKLNQANMAKISLAIPPMSILENISVLFETLYDTYRKCCTEMATLSTLRDTLLPKLMSGQIKV